MAHPDSQTVTVLIAHVTVHLVNGSTFDLLPFTSAEDVKSEVSDLMESWSKSGFLLRGRHIYSWHQIASIEITSVEEMSRSESEQRLLDWEMNDRYRLQQGFWKTKESARNERRAERRR